MNRRQRHERIIESWATPGTISACGRVDRTIDHVISTLGFAAFSDEAIEMLARKLVSDRAFGRKLNEQNRKLRAAS